MPGRRNGGRGVNAPTLSPAVWTVLQQLQDSGQKVRRSGSGFSFCCPAHDDRQASGVLSEGADGRALIHCHAGCSTEAVITALGLRMSALFPDDVPPQSTAPGTDRRIATTYPYRDAEGTLRYEVVRFAPKDFRQRRPDGRGGWVWNLQGVERLPYRLPEVLAGAAEAVWITEGEKDADRLVEAGFVATCNSGGAGKFGPELVRWFKQRDVVIVADQDAAGWRHCFQVAWLLEPVAASARVVDILPAAKDVSDLAQQIQDHGGNQDDVRRLLLALADRAPMVLDDWAPVPRV